jgi:hypothetical protein
LVAVATPPLEAELELVLAPELVLELELAPELVPGAQAHNR